MKKIIAVLSGLIFGFAAILILTELFKGAAASIFYNAEAEYSFSGFYLSSILAFPEKLSTWSYIFIYTIPLFASLIFTEAGFIFLSRSKNDHIKNSLLIFIVVNLGFIIVSILIGVLSALIPSLFDNDWKTLFTLTELTKVQQLLLLMFILFLFFTHVNLLAKRLRTSIPSIQKLSKDPNASKK